MSLQEPSQRPSTPSSQEKSARKRPVSERRIQANRRNALRSTGPKTARGKRTIARNAIKHGLLAREVVITAGDGEEILEEFHSLLVGLCESYEPMGVVEESLVQTIAACWWRKARVIRAENGEIRKRLDTIAVDRALRDSDKANLILAVSNIELGFFSRENPADKIPLMEQWATMQGAQSTLRAHHTGLAYLRVILEKAKAEMASDGYLSEKTRGAIFCEFGFWDYLFALLCSQAGPRAAKKDQPFEAVDDKEDKEEEKKCAAVVALIDDRLEGIDIFKGYALEREKLQRDAEARSYSLPPADETDKLLRYESHLDRQLYRAMDQLERLQRQRRGENVPPPLNINLGKRN
jgi:hypothetical protein